MQDLLKENQSQAAEFNVGLDTAFSAIVREPVDLETMQRSMQRNMQKDSETIQKTIQKDAKTIQKSIQKDPETCKKTELSNGLSIELPKGLSIRLPKYSKYQYTE